MIKGIAYKKKNKIISTDEKPFMADLDSLPLPALHLLNLNQIFKNKYFSPWRNNPVGKRTITIFTSRGCPYNCCFCSVHSQVGYKYRVYSIDYVIKLMKKCIDEYGINHFHFEDDNLTLMQRIKSLTWRIIFLTEDAPFQITQQKIPFAHLPWGEKMSVRRHSKSEWS